MRPIATAAALFLAFAAPAIAEDEPPCDDQTSNVELTACIWSAYETADQELNEVWHAVLETIGPSDFMPVDAAKEWKDHLVAAQRAWVTFKEEDCNGAVAFEWYGGTGANAAVGACLYGLTVARTQSLRDRYLAGR